MNEEPETFFMYDKDEDERLKLLREVDEVIHRKQTPESKFLRKFIFELINAAHEKKNSNNLSSTKNKFNLPIIPPKENKFDQVLELKAPEFKEENKYLEAERMTAEQVRDLPVLPIRRTLPILPKPSKLKKDKITIKELPYSDGDFPYLSDRNIIEHDHLKEQQEGLIQRYLRESREEIYAPKVEPKFKNQNWNDMDLYMKTPRIDAIYCDGAGIPIRVSYNGRMFRTETSFKDNKEIEEFLKKIFADMKIYNSLEPVVSLKLKNGFELHAIIGQGNIKTRFILTRFGN